MKKCFVISPIGDENSEERKRSDKLFNYIVNPVCNDEFEVIRADKIQHNNKITDEIIKNLKDADLVIADITDHNPNCFYEIGFRFALNPAIILMRDKQSTIPFDIKDIRVIEYTTDVGDVENAKTQLRETISNINFTKSISPNNNDSINENISLKLDKIQNSIYSISDSIESLSTNQDSSNSQEENKFMYDLLLKMMDNPEGFKQLMEITNQLDK